MGKKAKKTDAIPKIVRGGEATAIFMARKTAMDSRPAWMRTRSGRNERAIHESAEE